MEIASLLNHVARVRTKWLKFLLEWVCRVRSGIPGQINGHRLHSLLMWLYILQGIGYGFAAGVQPGPLQTYIISQTLTKGWRRSLPAAFAPLISDGPIIAICLLVLSQVPLWLQRFLYIAGGYLFCISLMTRTKPGKISIRLFLMQNQKLKKVF